MYINALIVIPMIFVGSMPLQNKRLMM